MMTIARFEQTVRELRTDILSGELELDTWSVNKLLDLSTQIRHLRDQFIRNSPASNAVLSRQFGLSEARISQIRNYYLV